MPFGARRTSGPASWALCVLLGLLVGLLPMARAWGRVLVGDPQVDLAEARVGSVDVDLVIYPRTVEAGGRAAHRQRARLEGRAVYRVEAPALMATELVLLDFASHLQREPDSLDEVTMDGYADGPWVGARTEVTAARVDGRGLTVRRSPRGDVHLELPAGAVEIEIEYELVVPRRLGPSGVRGADAVVGGGRAAPERRRAWWRYARAYAAGPRGPVRGRQIWR